MAYGENRNPTDADTDALQQRATESIASRRAPAHAWNDSLYLTEVIVFAGYQLKFEPALLVV